MALCRELGVSHSHFMGGRRRWTDRDRDLALAYEAVRGEACGSCGTLEEDWRDEDGYPLDEPVWTPVTRRCPGCEEIERLQARIPTTVKGARVVLIPFSELDFETDAEMTTDGTDEEPE